MQADLLRRAGITVEKDEKARRAVQAFRALQPTLTAYARILTKRKDVRVEMAAADNGSTDGKRIFFRPPIALGDNRPHDRALCDKRDENLQQLCPACAVREEVLVTIYHEIAHICCETMQEVRESDILHMIDSAVANHGTKYGEQISQRIKQAPYDVRRSYLGLAGIISPFLPPIVNALEDARVNAEQFKSRRGTKIMFESDVWATFNKGVEQLLPSGETERIMWSEYPLNAQVIVGLFVKASGYAYDTFFAEQVVEALNDPELTNLVNRLSTARNVAAVYFLSFPILARLRELGYCKSDQDPEPEPDPEGDEGEPDTAQPDQDKQEDGDESPDSPPEDASGSGSDPSDQSDPTDGSEQDQQPSRDGEAGEEEVPEPDDSEAGTDSEDGGGSGSDHEESSGDGEADEDPSDDDSGTESELGDGSEEDSQAGEAESEADDDERSGDHGSGTPDAGEGSPSEQPSEGAVDGEEEEAGEEGAGSGEDSPESGRDGSSEGDPDDADGEPNRAGDGAGSDDIQPEESDISEEGSGDLDDQDRSGNSGDPSGEGGDPSGAGGESTSDPSGMEGQNDAASEGDGIPPEAGDSSDTSITPSPDSSKPGGKGDAPDSELDVHPDSSGDAGVETPEAGPGDEVLDDSGDVPSESGGDDDPWDSGADDGTGGIEVIEKPENDGLRMGTAEEANIKLMEWMGHGDKPISVEEQAMDEAVIDRAIIQGIYFETPSRNIWGVREHHFGTPTIANGYIVSGAWDGRHWGRSRTRIGADGDFNPPETIIGPALLRMRVAFSDNARGKEQRHLKSGKVNSRVLGRRAPFNDERLFQRRTLPGKRDYFVLIGMDVSGSTVGKNIALEKLAVTAQAELLHRMGIKFAIYAHSGNQHEPRSSTPGMDLEVYLVKEPHEPWSAETKHRLAEIGPDSCNLDGHALEYMRKVCDRITATDKIILYYSDGKMPAENHDEELEILQREIKVCAKKGYTLLGVGIRTDSPARHGLDTVQVDSEADVVKVVQHIEKRLLAR